MAKLDHAHVPTDVADNPAVSTQSHFNDLIWYMDGWRPGGVGPSHFRWPWGFELPDGSLFTAPQWRDLAITTKRFLLSLRDDPPTGRTPCSMTTIGGRYRLCRVLIDWMARHGYRRYRDLDRGAVEHFIDDISARKSASGKPISLSTVRHYGGLLRGLYMQGPKIVGGLPADPMTGAVDKSVFIGGRRAKSMGGNKPYTPDEVAVPLVASAIRLIGTPANDIITLRDYAQTQYTALLDNGLTQTKAGLAVGAELKDYTFSTIDGEDAPWRAPLNGSTKEVRELTDRLVDACLVVILYLVGMRISEVLALDGDCIIEQSSAQGDEPVFYIKGKIFKTAPNSDGKPHLWVAPEPVVRAINVMRELTAPYREISDNPALFQSMLSSGLIGPNPIVSTPSASAWNKRLSALFAPFIDLPDYEGQPWRITTHQGRKTFARFVGKRDRTGLHALQKHYGHVTRIMTDAGYVGTDFELDDLVDKETLSETHGALEKLITATRLAGPAGRRIAAGSILRGRTVDMEVSKFVDWILNDTAMRLGVCDWGYCVYRQESSACQGYKKGPNEALRTESICAGCPNFALTDVHAPYWQDRLARNKTLLEHDDLDEVSRSLAIKRVAECETLLSELENDKI